jgi:hypothetical protein
MHLTQFPPELSASRNAQRGVVRARAQLRPLISPRALASLVATVLFSMVIVFAFAALAHAQARGAAPTSRDSPASLVVSRILPVVLGVLIGGGLGWLRRSRESEEG